MAEDEELLTVDDITQENTPLEALEVTWKTLVVFRNVALKANDFQRAMLYTDVITDFAVMIQSQGVELPSLEGTEG